MEDLKWNRAKLNVLSDIIVNRIDEVFYHFDLDYPGGTRIYRPCPIHDGNNYNGMSIYLKGDSLAMYWVCRTHHCEKTFRPTVLGFIRGLLSVKLKRWNGKNHTETVGFTQTVDYVCKLLDIDFKTLKVDEQALDKSNFLSSYRVRNIAEKKGVLTREQVRKHLHVGERNHLYKDFPAELLDRYDIGFCDRPDKLMRDRIVFPVYDSTHDWMIGCLGRSIFEKCEQCSLYHKKGNCPSKSIGYSKWLNSDFNCKNYLFNYWFARNHIKQSKTAVIVESPGNTLRLEEAGIHNSVALFGTSLSDSHQCLLEKASAMNLIVALDNDEAGRIGVEDIHKKCGKLYNIETIDWTGYDASDIADLNIEETKKLFERML